MQDIPGQGSTSIAAETTQPPANEPLKFAPLKVQGCPCSTAFAGSPLPTKPMPRSRPGCTRPFPQVPVSLPATFPAAPQASPLHGLRLGSCRFVVFTASFTKPSPGLRLPTTLRTFKAAVAPVITVASHCPLFLRGPCKCFPPPERLPDHPQPPLGPHSLCAPV